MVKKKQNSGEGQFWMLYLRGPLRPPSGDAEERIHCTDQEFRRERPSGDPNTGDTGVRRAVEAKRGSTVPRRDTELMTTQFNLNRIRETGWRGR